MLIRVGDKAAINLRYVRGIKIEGTEAVVLFDGTTSDRFDNSRGEFGDLIRSLPDRAPTTSAVGPEIHGQADVEPSVDLEDRPSSK